MPPKKCKTPQKPKETLKAQGKGWIKLYKVEHKDGPYLELRLRLREYKEMKLEEED